MQRISSGDNCTLLAQIRAVLKVLLRLARPRLVLFSPFEASTCSCTPGSWSALRDQGPEGACPVASDRPKKGLGRLASGSRAVQHTCCGQLGRQRRQTCMRCDPRLYQTLPAAESHSACAEQLAVAVQQCLVNPDVPQLGREDAEHLIPIDTPCTVVLALAVGARSINECHERDCNSLHGNANKEGSCRHRAGVIPNCGKHHHSQAS